MQNIPDAGVPSGQNYRVGDQITTVTSPYNLQGITTQPTVFLLSFTYRPVCREWCRNRLTESLIHGFLRGLSVCAHR